MKCVTLATVATLAAGSAFAESPTAQADMAGPDGADMGRVEITQGPRGILFHAEVSGLKEGWHGFHVHKKGSCEDGFEAAKGHYAPDGNKHGLMNEDGSHAGDLPNIHVDANGEAWAEFYSERLSVKDGDAPLMDDDGSAIMIHAKPDSYAEKAGAGGRVACGVIEAAK